MTNEALNNQYMISSHLLYKKWRNKLAKKSVQCLQVCTISAGICNLAKAFQLMKEYMNAKRRLLEFDVDDKMCLKLTS